MISEQLDYHFIFGIIGGIFSIIALIPYIVGILQKRVKPNRASWIIWNVTNLILLASYFSVGARPTIFLPIIYLINTLTVLILSYHYGFSSWSRLDYISLTISGISLVIWILTENPLLALLMNLVMDAVAYLPTIKKSYLEPLSESNTAWLLFFLGSFFNLFAINSMSFGIMIYPIFNIVTNGILVTVLFRKRIFKVSALGKT